MDNNNRYEFYAINEDAPVVSKSFADEVNAALLLEEEKDNKRKQPKISKPKKEKKPKGKKDVKRILLISFTSLINIFAMVCFFVVYGPISSIRDWYVTTALSTGTHQYLANVFYDDDTIKEVIANNTLVEPDAIMDSNAITVGEMEIPTTFSSVYEQQVLERDPEDLYKMIELKENGYHGYVLFVYDPTRISLATAQNFGNAGEFLSDMAKRKEAVVAVNAGGHGSNGVRQYPSGYVYVNGKIAYERHRSSKWGGGSIGFSKDGILILTKKTGKAALNEGIYNGVDFGPFLIVNGKSSKISGNGGFGAQPRTCIGQRQDGIVVFLVIEGRSAGSSGVTLDTCIDIFERYNVYNAANLDGGGSSTLIVNNKLVNNPVGYGYSGERYLVTGWMIK